MFERKTKIFLLVVFTGAIILAKYFFGHNQWKTYTYNQCGNFRGSSFSFKIPLGWEESIIQTSLLVTDYNYSSSDFSLTISCGSGFGNKPCGLDNEVLQKEFS